jgi:TetR/AcrR family transcriptional regulator
MQATSSKSRPGSRRRPQETRAAILQAAVREFSREGVAGARTDAIARAARVNKALLYYYFKDKEALYGAVLDQVFGGLTIAVQEALSRDLPPKEKILAYAGAHFDYIASHPLYPRIVQGEMMNAGRGKATHVERIVQQYFRPLLGRLAEVLRRGIASGEFRAVDPLQFVPSMISVIVFYFINAPVMRLMTGADPLAPASVAERRAAVLDFISAALFRGPHQKREGERRERPQ